MINKNTKLYFSISSSPGNFGTILYNTAFNELGVDAIYKPLKLERKNNLSFAYLLESLFLLDTFSGLSISMPFKKDAINWCDVIEEKSQIVGNINTFVVRGEKGYGYNTDVIGFERSNREILENAKSAVIVGNGAAAESIKYVLGKYSICFISMSSRERLTQQNSVNDFDWLINCSPVGMEHISDNVFTKKFVKSFKYVFDVVVSNKPTNLIKLAKKLKKPYVQGWEMSLEQLCNQFELYVKEVPPIDVFLKTLRENGYGY